MSKLRENDIGKQVTDQVQIVLQTGSNSKLQILNEVLKKTSHLYNYIKFIYPLSEHGLIEPTIKDKPNSPKQEYRITELGLLYFN